MLLLFRGINNNVSWSFTNSIFDILLDIFFAPVQSICTYPGPDCQNPSSVPFQRSASQTNQDILLSCDRRNLARFNDTLCADLLTGSKVASSSVVTFCQALSSLSPSQIERVWSNMCYVIQALVPPLLSMSSACTGVDVPPTPNVTSASAPGRVAREAPNLRQLACSYSGWLENKAVDPVLVTVCSDNDREQFVKQVCNDALLMRKLLTDQTNSWLYAYCANSSADRAYMVSKFCVYEEWISQPTVVVGPSLLEFCIILDSSRLIELICQHTGFFMLLFSNPDNVQFMPNCTSFLTPLPDIDSFMLNSCRYSQWRPTEITTDVLWQCILLDQSGFALEVCSNATFLNSLLQNKANYWLEDHCSASLVSLTPEPSQSFRLSDWCDYQTWGEREVDVSVIGLCWENDQPGFEKNVCCKVSVYEKLIENPLNKWLSSVCTGLLDKAVLPQVSVLVCVKGLCI